MNSRADVLTPLLSPLLRPETDMFGRSGKQVFVEENSSSDAGSNKRNEESGTGLGLPVDALAQSFD